MGINLDTLQRLSEEKKISKFDKAVLVELNLVNKNDLVKILGRGELTSKIEVEANKFTKTAAEAIEKAGGSFVSI